jgi:PhnB protein
MNTEAVTRTTQVQPYLFFGGRCEEALEFYRDAVGADVTMKLRFDESPDPVPAGMLPPGFGSKVMHSELRIGATTILASDGCSTESSPAGFSLALSVPTVADADRTFAKLADGGQVTMPLGKTFWSPRYGMLKDRFGIAWMVMVPPANAP